MSRLTSHTQSHGSDPHEHGMPGRLHFAMLTYGALESTQRCVQSLLAHTGVPFDLWVVDNASNDGTQAWLKSRTESWFHHRCNATNRGVPGGRNDLCEFVLPEIGEHDWLVFIDNDLEFLTGWVDPFVAAMRRFPQARVLGRVGHFIEVVGAGRHLAIAAIETSHADIVSGGFACFVRADAARMIGAFDERLGLFWHEDDDYCLRAIQQGFDVVAVPESAITHHEHASGVADTGLSEGGSLTNQAYLVDKWRQAGWIDRDGWVVRQHGPYVTPDVRDALQRISARATPIGRSEIAAATMLLDDLIDQEDPLVWFDAHRQPVPQCFAALVTYYSRQAHAGGDMVLVQRLERITDSVACGSNARLLRAMVREAKTQAEGDHGLCAAVDFDEPHWQRAADALGVGMLMRDSYGRDRGIWEEVTALRRLLQEGLVRPAARILFVDVELPLLAAYLIDHKVDLIRQKISAVVTDSPDAVFFGRRIIIDGMRQVLATCGDETLVVLIGDASLNGTPGEVVVQPHQIELDLLARLGLVATSPVRTAIDDEVLEACVDRPERDGSRPHLSRLHKAQLLTSYVVFARRAKIKCPAELMPAVPRGPVKHTIGIDLRTLARSDSVSRGIGQYTQHHLLALALRAPDMRLVGYTLGPANQLPASLIAAGVQQRDLDVYDPREVDLLHVPDPMNMTLGFDSPLRVMKHRTSTVLFHDLTPLHYYLQRWSSIRGEVYMDRLQQVQRSDTYLLTNSVFTASDLQQHLSIGAERITPVLAGLHGAGRREQPPGTQIEATLALLGVYKPYVLHVGAHDPHKNFPAALSTFLRVRGTRSCQFVVVGAVDSSIAYIAAVCAAKKIPDVVFTGFLPREHLDCLYASATALLFLSRAEGFGFPILEAMAAGCPVVASDTTSLPEVVGDAGVLVDPDDQVAAATAVRRLMDDEAYAAQLRRAGLDQAAGFTWEAVADRTLAVWRRMLAQPRPQHTNQPSLSICS